MPVRNIGSMRSWLLAGVLVCLSIVTALAALSVPSAARAGEKPCMADIEKLCAGVKPGGGRLRACIDQHKAEFSADCQVHVDKVKADLADANEACGDDAHRVCGDAVPGGGRVLQCLIDRKSQLDLSCRLKLEKAGNQVRKNQEKVTEKIVDAQEACSADIAKFCPDVQPGAGRVIQCLKGHQGDLTSACRSSLP